MSPLTLDDAAVTIQLDGLDPDIASEGGTDLGAVLRQGRELLAAAAERGARAMVLFTDGETLDSVDAAISAAERHPRCRGDPHPGRRGRYRSGPDSPAG